MSRAIPAEILSGHTAVLGMTGSGKTSTEKLIIEQVVEDGARVCVLDTLKSDWWGITSSASGKRAGLPFKILGGPRGHVPLHSSAGKAIGQLVGSGKLPLSIVDMADFEAGGLQRFFVDFAQALWKSVRGVVYLVIEEAHEVAPKERAGFGAENMAIHWAKKLATGSRTKGIRLIVATQRVQSLHNAVLGSCGTLIAHRLAYDADQEPVIKWLKGTNKALAGEIAESLSSLPDGTGWICNGRAGVFQRIAFPKFKTYDNTKTPDGDSDEFEVTTAAVDETELRALIGDAVKDADATDVKKLQGRIADLERQLRDRPTHETVREVHVSDPHEIAVAEERGYQRCADQLDRCADQLDRAVDRIVEFYRSTGSMLRMAEEAVGMFRFLDPIAPSPMQFQEAITRSTSRSGSPPSSAVGPASGRKLPERAVLRESVPRATTPHRPSGKPSPEASGGGTLKPALQNAVDAIAWWRKIGFDPIERSRACVVAGLSPRASTFGVYVAELVKLDLVEVPAPGKVKLTDAGWSIANVPTATTAAELRRMVSELLSPKPRQVFDVIYKAYPREVHRRDVAEAVNLSPTASTTGVYIAEVAAFGIVETSSPGHVRAADWLFP